MERRLSPPLLGQANAEILAKLGYTSEKLRLGGI